MLRRIFKTSFYSLSSRGFLTLTNLSIIFLISKFLKSSELGVYAITFFYYYLSSVLSSLGLKLYLSKEIAYRKEDNTFKETVIKEVFTSFSVGLLLALFVVVLTQFFYNKIELSLLIPVIISGLLLGVETNLSGILLGEERMNMDTFYQAINTIIVLGLAILYINKIGILGIFLLRMGASLITIVLRLFYLKTRNYRIKLKLIIRDFINKEKLFFFMSSLLNFILRQIDIFILSLIITKELLGSYFLALRIYLAFGLFAEIMSISFTPFISRIYRGIENRNFTLFNKKVLRYFAVGSFIFSISLFFSRNGITTFFSEEYLNTTGKFLMYFSFILFFRFMHNYSGNILTATEYQNKRFYILLSSSIILILLNITLGCLYSVYGVILARAVVEIFIFTAYWITIKKIPYPANSIAQQ